ncbi:MAG: hypothetical protein IH610_02870 [Deltaproteobacteria bacterium]|nr:hypothetical protein [Deltaproteobacteria bacterium]
MKTLRNEKGFALVFVLILAAISLALTLAMLIMVSRGSYVSGQQKRFRTAVEAGRGGMEAMFELISNRGNPDPLYTMDNAATIQIKLATPTYDSATNVYQWGGLDDNNTINPANNTTYDMWSDNMGTYRVYAKIVDTVDGNSGADEGLSKTAVVNAGSGEVTVVSVPYLYTIEVLSQSRTNPSDRSKLSILYQY